MGQLSPKGWIPPCCHIPWLRGGAVHLKPSHWWTSHLSQLSTDSSLCLCQYIWKKINIVFTWYNMYWLVWVNMSFLQMLCFSSSPRQLFIQKVLSFSTEIILHEFSETHSLCLRKCYCRFSNVWLHQKGCEPSTTKTSKTETQMQHLPSQFLLKKKDFKNRSH